MNKDLIKDSFKSKIFIMPKVHRYSDDFWYIHLSFYLCPGLGIHFVISHLTISLGFNYTLFFKNLFNKDYTSDSNMF